MKKHFTLICLFIITANISNAGNVKQRLDSLISHKFYKDKFVKDQKRVFTYNANNKVVEERQFSWFNDLWSITTTTKYNYNNDGLLEKLEMNNSNEELIKYESYKYNENKKLIEMKEYNLSIFIINPLIKSSKSEYNSDGFIISKIDSLFEDSIYYKTNYIYDQGSLVEEKLYYSDNLTLEYNLRNINYLYDWNNNLRQEKVDEINLARTNFTRYQEINITLDAYGNPTEKTSYWINDSLSVFEMDKKQTFSVNKDVLYEDLILPLDFSFRSMPGWSGSYADNNSDLQFTNQVTNFKTVYGDTTNFNSRYEVPYYSEQISLNNDEISINLISVYPNPSSESIMVSVTENESANFVLSDVNGKYIFSQLVSGIQNINISDLNQGIYFYSLSINDKIESGKLIKN